MRLFSEYTKDKSVNKILLERRIDVQTLKISAVMHQSALTTKQLTAEARDIDADVHLEMILDDLAD